MKVVDAAVSNAIRTSNNVTALPRLIANWNMNRYIGTTVTNTPSEDTDGNDIEMFPIESIAGPDRPTKGINKARIGQGVMAEGRGVNPDQPRFYVASVDDKYKYWQSPYLSDGAGNITGVNPQVVYASSVSINKIVVKLENSWASPTAFVIQTTTVANPSDADWTLAYTNPSINADGSVVIYWNGTAWTNSRPANLSTLKSVRGIRLVVTKLGAGKDRNNNTMTYVKSTSTSNATPVRTSTTGANSYFSLIELAGYREEDLSPYMVSCTDTFDTSDVSMLYPVGSLTTNTATVSLYNGDGLFNQDNPDSPYHAFLQANAEINLEYVYKINGVDYPVQQFKLFSQSWTGQKDDTCTLNLGDFSTQFQQSTPNPILFENLTLPDIVYRICDSIGFVDYKVIEHPDLTNFVIPIFWIDGESTVWQIFDDLAKATQSAIYFDAWGIMQIKTREAAFDRTSTPVWTLRGQSLGNEMTDIATMNQTEDFENNVVTVSYQTTKWSDFNNGLPTLSTVWEPDSAVTLRASNLQATLTNADITKGVNSYFKLTPGDAKIWPYSGLVNIEGEIIRFEGKEFVYYTDTVDANGKVITPAGTRHVVNVKTADEYTKYNTMISNSLRIKNYFTGRILMTERGAWNSMIAAHGVAATGYSIHGWLSGTYRQNVSGFTFNSGKSTVTLKSNSRTKTTKDFLVASHGSVNDTPWTRVGTKIRFNAGSSNTTQQGGIVFNNQGGFEDGYYVELIPTGQITGAMRKTRNELLIYARNGGKITSVNGKGAALAIIQNRDYEIDVNITSNHTINVWINGRLISGGTVPTGQRLTPNGKFGMFVRGKTSATYQYLYGIARSVPDPIDDFSWVNKVEGGYVGGLFDREWVYNWQTATRIVKKRSVKYQQRHNQQFMDEFGPIVHEIREYDVKFDPNPVLHSRLFSTNDWNSACIEYRSTPFGAHFIVANVSRNNAVLQGTDTLSAAGTGSSIEQQMIVIGRALVINDAATVEARNEQSIITRGEIEATMDSPWIQSKDAAQTIADWMQQHWSDGIDGLTVDIFGNPLIEVGDIVKIDYPVKDMTPEESQYFVTGTSTSFDSGLTTSLTLRRVATTV